MLAQNVTGSQGHHPPKYKTWIEYYRRHYKIKYKLTCSEYYCDRKDIHGAHINIYFLNIIKVYHKTYIIPLCPKHNNPKNIDTFYIKYNTKFLECDFINYKLYLLALLILFLVINTVISYVRSLWWG